MRKLLLGLVLVLVPLFASAQNSETLLTPDGTLYRVEMQFGSQHPEVQTDAYTYLLLTKRNGTDVSREVVPASLTSGGHSNPALAYDSDTDTLFLFWLHDVRLLDSELLFAARHADGTWTEPTAFGDIFDFRENLHIAVTRKVAPAQDDPTGTPTVGTSVHATWWEFDSRTGRESAQYAMFTIDNGQVASIDFLGLDQFVGSSTGAGADNYALLKNPSVFPSPKQDSVVVMFGDLATQSFNQVRIFPTRPPTTTGRLRVPVGRREAGFGAPDVSVTVNGEVGSIYQDGENVAFYIRNADHVDYLIHRESGWSTERTVNLDDEITAPAAIDAIRKLLHEN